MNGWVDDSALERIHRRIARHARDMQSEPSADVHAVLADLVAAAVADVPGAQYAGITVIRGRTEVKTEATTHRYPALLDDIEQRHLQGPCLEAQWQEHTVRVPDLATETRWPAYCRDALALTPIRSILSFQLFAGRETMGALNVYSEHPHVFTSQSADLGTIFATHAALAWRNVRREHQFASALASRDIIGQAKGMIMERFDVDAVQAFELLKTLSQEANTPLTQVAERLVVSKSEESAKTTAHHDGATPRQERRRERVPQSGAAQLAQLPALVVLNRLPVPVLAFNEDRSIVFANDAFATMLGYPEGAALHTMVIDELFRDLPMTPTVRDAVRAYAGKVVELVHADGSTVNAKMSKSALIRDGDTIALITFEDLTEQLWTRTND